MLIVESGVTETPEPTCSVCSIVTRTAEDSDAAVVVTLASGVDFEGDVELRVWLETEEWVSVWIPQVTIDAEGTTEVELEVEWAWDDVRLARTSFYPVS